MIKVKVKKEYKTFLFNEIITIGTIVKIDENEFKQNTERMLKEGYWEIIKNNNKN